MKFNQLIKLGRREPSENAIEHNWTQLNPQKIKLNKQTIVIFGGNTTDDPSVANGYAKNIERLLSKKDRANLDILSFSYSSEFIRSPSMMMDKEYEACIIQIYHDMFEPLLYNEHGYMKEKQGVEKTFQNLVFVGHCGGCNFVNIIFDCFYKSLLKKYPPATAEILMNKLQYVAYAPNEFSSYDTNSLIITPYIDSTYSWSRMLGHVLPQKVDNDYPKGVSKELLKQKNLDRPGFFINGKLQDYRSLVFKKGSSFYMIPGQMNPNQSIGDHSIECITSPKIIESDTDCAQTAKVANAITKMIINNYFTREKLDGRQIFNNITNIIYDHSPISQCEFS